MNEPLGSDIVNGTLYLADRDGGTGPTDPSVSVVRTFNMKTGMPGKEFKVEKSAGFNDIAIDKAGNIYGTVTGSGDGARVWKITADGTASIFAQNAPLVQPNGVAIDPQGNIVVVNIGNPDVITFSPDAKVVKTEKAAQAGNDGIVIMSDGTKYVSSVVKWRRVADSSESGGRADRAERAERGVDVLRLGRESAGHPNECKQCARIHSAQVGCRNMFRHLVTIATLAAVSVTPASVGAQDRPHTGTLVVVTDPSKPLILKPADLAGMPRTSITVKQPDGRGVTHEGVLVAELLKRAGAPLGKALRGDAVATYVLATATDGYRVIFSLAEVDPEFSGGEIMVVDRTNGQALLADQGPIRIIAPKDLAGARSIRMLERIEVVRVAR